MAARDHLSYCSMVNQWTTVCGGDRGYRRANYGIYGESQEAVKSFFAYAEKHWWLVLLLVGAAVFGLSMLVARGQSVWFDEGYSILLAKRSFSELLSLTAVDAHPPLYYILLKAWGEVFGFSEFALRSMSAIFAAGTAVLGVALTRKLFGTRIAIIAIPFVIFAPFMLRYGYEIRMYSLVAFLGVLGTYILVNAVQTKKLIWWLLYAVVVAAGMYTLYSSIVIWIVHAIWLTYLSIKDKKSIFLWRWPLVFIGAIVLFLPYLSTFISQSTNSVLSGVGKEVTLSTLVNMTTLFLIYTPDNEVNGWVSLGLVVLAVLLVPLVWRGWKRVESKKRIYMVLYLMLAGLPLLIYALLSLSKNPIFLPRYMAHVAVWVYLSLGILIGYGMKFAKTKRHSIAMIAVLAVLMCGVVALSSRGNFVFDRWSKPVGREIAAGISCNNQATVVMDGPQEYIDLLFYFDKCDARFAASYNPEYRGGFAMLHNSQQRVASSSELSSSYVWVIRWEDRVYLEMDSRYEFVSEKNYDKYRVSVYRLKE